jgi:hypothetical protein
MVFRREALQAIGGVECAQGQLVDDMAIGKHVYEAGYKNVMSRAPLHIATGGMSFRQFLPVYRRWMMFSRNGLPFSFTWPQYLQGAEFFTAFLATLAGLVSGHALAALVPATALLALATSLVILQRGYGGESIPSKYLWAPFAFYLVSPVVLLQNTLKKKVEWRGRAYDVTATAALAPAPLAATTAAAGPVVGVASSPSSMLRRPVARVTREPARRAAVGR